MKRLPIVLCAITLLAVGCDRKTNDEQSDQQTTEQQLAASTQPSETPDDSGSQEDEAADDESASSDHAAHGSDGMPENLAPGESQHYGAAFTVDSEPMTLAASLEQCLDTNEPCRVKADIGASCQSSGCWFTLEDEDVDTIVRVEMKDYGFFIPKNAHETTAEIEGTLENKTIPAATARHYARESGDPEAAAEIEGPQKAFVWTITGVTLTNPEE